MHELTRIWNARPLTLGCVMIVAVPAFGGTLFPEPGPIEPTGRFGPRVEIKQLPFTVDEPGSYYIAKNLSGVPDADGILVNVNNVTIDLNGFSLIGVEDSLTGIRAAFGTEHLTVVNGTIRGWADRGGLFAHDSRKTLLLNLVVVENDVAGIQVGDACIVRNCITSNNGGIGLLADPGSVVSHCSVYQNNGIGIAAGGSTVTDCSVKQNSLDGIVVPFGGLVSNCTSVENGQNGIVCDRGTCVTQNSSFLNGGAGIYVRDIGTGCRVDGNNVSENQIGVHVDGSGHFVARNTANGNATNFDIVAGNNVCFSTDPTTAGAWCNLDY